jgi:hypothetical protein
MVQTRFDTPDGCAGELAQTCPFGHVLADQSVGIFVARALSWSPRIGEEDINAHVPVSGKLGAVIQRERVGGQAAERASNVLRDDR